MPHGVPYSQPYVVVCTDTHLHVTVVGPFASQAQADRWARLKDAQQIGGELQFLVVPLYRARTDPAQMGRYRPVGQGRRTDPGRKE